MSILQAVCTALNSCYYALRKSCLVTLMLSFLPAPLIGIIAVILYTLNLLFWPIPVFICALLRLIPVPGWQEGCTAFMHKSLNYWASGNSVIQRLTTRIEWDIQGIDQLKADDWYLLLSNHNSWVDILVLVNVFNYKIPSLRFFMKKEMLWMLPIAGMGAWLLDFPLMGRYSKSEIAKNPGLKGKDLATTRKACEKFKNIPTTIINFVEGTRYTPAKHQQQASPYQYLLRPKAGGVAFTLGVMGDYFHKILNVTIVYPGVKISAWDFFCGKINKIVVRVEELDIPPELLGNYENDRAFRVYFQNWLNELWYKKDQLITQILQQNNSHGN